VAQAFDFVGLKHDSELLDLANCRVTCPSTSTRNSQDIHKQDFVASGGFGRSHTALPLVTNNGSATQVHFRKCIKVNSP